MTAKPFIPEVKRLHEQAVDEPISALFYGAAGTSKTWSAGTYGSRTLFINVGHGLATIQSPEFQAKYPCDPLVINIDRDDPDAYDKMTDSIEFMFRNHIDDFDLLVIDEITAVRKAAMWKALQINKDFNKTGTLTKAEKSGVVSPEIADWGEEMNVMNHFLQEIFTACKSARKHLVVIAHEKHTYGKPAKIGDLAPITKTRPAFTGKSFPDEVVSLFDLVWYFTAAGKGKTRKFFAVTQPSELLVVKTRFNGIFLEEEANVNLQDIIKRIRTKAVLSQETIDNAVSHDVNVG